MRAYFRKTWIFGFAFLMMPGCAILHHDGDQALLVPYIKNSPNECYYLDEFMPIPNNLVTGKSGSLSLRYYTYNRASYKDWHNKNQIILSFYSKDAQCWSLYEEYYVSD